IGKPQVFRVHHPKAFNMREPELVDAFLRLAQHRLGNVDAAYAIGRGIVRQRDAGADADFKDAAANAFSRSDGGLASPLENSAEDEIIDRSPSRIGFRDCLSIELHCCAHDSLRFKKPALRYPRAGAATAMPNRRGRPAAMATFCTWP